MLSFITDAIDIRHGSDVAILKRSTQRESISELLERQISIARVGGEVSSFIDYQVQAMMSVLVLQP